MIKMARNRKKQGILPIVIGVIAITSALFLFAGPTVFQSWKLFFTPDSNFAIKPIHLLIFIGIIFVIGIITRRREQE